MPCLFFDSNVWLRFIEEEKTAYLAKEVLKLITSGQVKLLVPDQLHAELERHMDRVLTTKKEGLNTYVKHAKGLAPLLDEAERPNLDRLCGLAEKKIPEFSMQYDETYRVIQDILANNKAVHISTSPAVKIAALDRALNKKAPFTRDKNSSGDAVLLEAVLGFQEENSKDSLYFVTLNSKDFSNGSNPKEPHDDLRDTFVRLNIRYSILPADVIEELGKIVVPPEVKNSFQPIDWLSSSVDDAIVAVIENYKRQRNAIAAISASTGIVNPID
jgi:hypothetical protein